MGTYRTIERIYQSRYSIVERARDEDTDRQVILKSASADESQGLSRDRILKEYDLLTQFSQEGIIAPIELIHQNRPVLVLPFIEGPLLKTVIQENTLSISKRIDLAEKLTRILGKIHAQRVIHLDINPTNIILSPDQEGVTILDFNISEQIMGFQRDFQGVDAMGGTLPYMSPEQTGRINRRVDYRSDYYGLGILFYELFTGQHPFESQDPVSLIHSHIAAEPRAPALINPDLPRPLSMVIEKLIKKDAEDRYQSNEGLLTDLAACKKILLSPKDFPDFIPGKFDIHPRLQISQKIYGRAKELQVLAKVFRQVRSGGFHHLFLHGYSGIGKTALVKEFFREITSSGSFCLTGKFDLLNRTQPYSALIEVLNGFVNLILAQGEEGVKYWKDRLNKALGDSAAVLAQLSPRLELILGEQPPLDTLVGIEAQNRLNHAIQTLVASVARADHPLVLLFDDLQWIDPASLALMKSLFENPDQKFLFFIGAYRSNEVDEGHPLTIFFTEYEMAHPPLNQHIVPPLEKEAVSELIDHTFTPLKGKELLVRTILEKTKGNIFFVKQLLTHLFDKEIIQFDQELGVWVTQDHIQKEKIADNVADFITQQMKEMDPELLEFLSVAACIGTLFNRSLVEPITKLERRAHTRLLEKAAAERLIIPLEDRQYMFSHDQIQAAFYTWLSPAQRSEIHSRIAAGLYAGPDEHRDEEWLDMAGHIMKMGQEQESRLSPDQIIFTLIRAGEIASKNTAYSDAALFYDRALAYTEETRWDSHYDQMLLLHNERALMAYMTGEPDKVDDLFSTIESHVTHVMDAGFGYDVKIQTQMAEQLYAQGIDTTIKALGRFGIDLPQHPEPKDHEKAFEKLGALMADTPVKSLETHGIMADKNHLVVMRILSSIIPITFNMNPGLMLLAILKMVELSVGHGNCKYSPFAYSLYGLVLCDLLGDVSRGTQFGELSISVLESLDNHSEIARVHCMTAAHVLHFKSPVSRIIRILDHAFTKGVENGDLTYAGFAGHGCSYFRYLAGAPLGATLRFFDTHRAAMEKYRQGTPALYQKIYMQTIENLMEKERDQWILNGPHFDEAGMATEFEEQNHKTALFVLFFNKMQLAYLFGAYEQAQACADQMEENLDGGGGLIQVPVFHEYSALIRLALYPDLNSKAQSHALEKIDDHLARIKPLEAYPNYAHRSMIVEAERLRVTGNMDKARAAYEDAVSAAAENGFLNEEALCRELAYRFYKESNKNEMRDHYLKSAISCYKKWGALSKAAQLTPDPKRHERDLFTDTIFSHQTVTTHDGFSSEIDLHSILKFSQAIAKEIEFETLLHRMLDILIENAGAQRAAVLSFPRDGGVICAEQGIETPFAFTKRQTTDQLHHLPLSIVNTALNAREILILDNAVTDDRFSRDPYITETRMKSLICFPLMNQGKTTGLIYMENNLAEHIFSMERVRFLTLLSSQISISFENALIYEKLETLVKQRTKELELRNSELESLNEKLLRISVTDSLTRLFNRRRIEEILAHELEKFQRYATPFSVILMDIDHFKEVNDTYGHNTGDKVLIRVGQILNSHTRKADFTGRWGGEEFIIVCPQTPAKEAAASAEKIRSLIQTDNSGETKERTASFGVAQCRRNEPVEELLKRADQCLYSAKEGGRNQVCSS